MVEQAVPGTPAVLRVENLSKNYGVHAAVSEVSFQIRAGEVLGVVGPNGSGKSTIVKMITGLMDPTRGEVSFRGTPIRECLEGYKHQLGYVPEQSDLYGFLTGWEYVQMTAQLRGMEMRQWRPRALALFDGFSMSHARNQQIRSYSKGMRQRIVLISALQHSPRLLVLDEPFSGLDVTSALTLRRVIELLAGAGKAIFFSSPVLEQVDRVHTHLLVLRGGRTVSSGSAEEMRSRFGGLDLESGVMQLTNQTDTDGIAKRSGGFACGIVLRGISRECGGNCGWGPGDGRADHFRGWWRTSCRG